MCSIDYIVAILSTLSSSNAINIIRSCIQLTLPLPLKHAIVALLAEKQQF